MSDTPEISVIVPVSERYDDVVSLYHAYKSGVSATGLKFEIIYVLDGDYPQVLAALEGLRREGECIQIVAFTRWFGEATALVAGFERSKGEIILILPAYEQVDPREIPRLVEALKNCDMVLARRWPRRDSWLNRLQSGAFNLLLRWTSELSIHDIGCGARALRRRVLQEIQLYGDLHRFLPLMAHQRGFKVMEVDIPQSERDAFQRIYSPGVYVRRLLDFLTVVFLVKFTKKPLRFFGLLGTGISAVGLAGTLYVVAERLLGGQALADRPALLLSSLLIVLGVQILAIGLIGEIIIFTHAKEVKEYTIKEVIN